MNNELEDLEVVMVYFKHLHTRTRKSQKTPVRIASMTTEI
jgi:hypothetical protein